jgi:hypothetical protein
VTLVAGDAEVTLGPGRHPARPHLQSLLAPKDQLVTICKNALAAITKSTAGDYLDQATNLAAAHCLLTFTAYFDAFSQCLPEFGQELRLTEEEKQLVAAAATGSPTAERRR